MDENKQFIPKVSIIVPVYHSESYLVRCCRSIFSQTLDDIECLFILDGPSEKAEQIITEELADYPHRQTQVRFICHVTNLGISYCRQEGHELSRGEFVYHCDSDDWLESDALQSAYELAQTTQADLVFFDYVRHYEETKKEVFYSTAHVQQGIINTMDGPLFNKLIRRQLIYDNDLRFPKDINWGEDLCMSVLLQIYAQDIKYLPRVLYHYCMHANSQTTEADILKYLQLVACPEYIELELSKRQLKDKYSAMLLQMKFEVKEYFLIHSKFRNVKQWITTYPECHSAIWQFNSVPLYLKCVSWLAANHMAYLAEVLLSCRDLIHFLRR